MSSHLAIATITATLRRMLQASVQVDVEGSRVTTVRPSDVGNGTPEMGVNVFMYQAITNPALHNVDVTPLRTRGNPVKRQAALDLYYMFSFYGNDNELIPQRMLGSIVRTLNDKRVITADMIRDTCADPTLSFLNSSTLAEQVQQINILPLDLGLEDLSKTWSVFFQTPYILSIAYKVLVVLVEGQEPAVRALPVRDRRAGGFEPFLHQPKIEMVQAEAGVYSPILADSTILIKGQQLQGETSDGPKAQAKQTQVRLCGLAVTPDEVSATQIKLSLSQLKGELRAGVQSLQVIHPIALAGGDYPQGRRGAESNAVPLVIRPRLLSVTVDEIEETDDDLMRAVVTVKVNLTVGKAQRVVLALNEDANQDVSAYLFAAPRTRKDASTLKITVEDVKPGEYLARLLIDGAESQLEIDNQPGSPTQDRYIGPKISITEVES